MSEHRDAHGHQQEEPGIELLWEMLLTHQHKTVDTHLPCSWQERTRSCFHPSAGAEMRLEPSINKLMESLCFRAEAHHSFLLLLNECSAGRGAAGTGSANTFLGHSSSSAPVLWFAGTASSAHQGHQSQGCSKFLAFLPVLHASAAASSDPGAEFILSASLCSQVKGLALLAPLKQPPLPNPHFGAYLGLFSLWSSCTPTAARRS